MASPLTCKVTADTEDGTALANTLCAALSDRLAAQEDPMILHVTAHSPVLIEAQLSDATGEPLGDPVQLSVVDRTLSAPMMDQFADTLATHVTGPPSD
ncbi:hypothetical protein AADZ90_010160 [Aestuariibius sp. 2305UL40-4]|uniref:hypothetical protein n=1 Tax=Aestuariibius violaceus TaxID=3234132 RepID=UPI00345E8DC4